MKRMVKASEEKYIYKINTKPISELRQDPVSGDWILIAPARLKRPELFVKKEKATYPLPKNKCPFENPQKFGNEPPLLVYQKESGKDWFLQVIPNKYPAVRSGRRGIVKKIGIYSFQDGTGSHEIVVLRDHSRHLAQYTKEEIQKILSAYQERYRSLAVRDYVAYISIFHNYGHEAGASVPHPHSQILALPVVPPDVSRSIDGSREYFHKNKRCIHCMIISSELKAKNRLVFENKHAVVFAPYASRSNFELRVFPKNHEACFEKVRGEELLFVAEALRQALLKIYRGLNGPSFNFFLHTAPVKPRVDYKHYHWHIEVLPKTSVWGGFELGTGIDIISMLPETTAAFFKKMKLHGQARDLLVRG